MNVRSLEFRLTVLVTLLSTLLLCVVGSLTYFAINRILLNEQDQALASRIERLEVLLQDSENIQQIIQRPKIYQNMLGNQDNLFVLMHDQQQLIHINPLNINIPKLAEQSGIHFLDLHQSQHSTRIAWKNFNIKGQSYQLIAGKQWSERLNILHQFRQDLFLYFGIGLVILFFSCWFTCHIILTGLRKLTQQTHQIDIGSLKDRLEIQPHSTEISQLSIAINHMLARIHAGYDQLNRFSENIAHEFRTPLNNLIGQTEIVLSETRGLTDYQDLLVSHLEEYQRLKRMIDRMLFLARADQQHIQLNIESVNVATLIDNMVSFLDLYASEKDITFQIQVRQQYVTADAELLQQALFNLVENAVLHAQNHSHIIIATQIMNIEQQSYTMCSVFTQNNFIDEKHLPHLFERFYQCNPSRHAQGRSGGLGLAIVASIVELHAGFYRVENTPEGICFSVYFPNDSSLTKAVKE